MNLSKAILFFILINVGLSGFLIYRVQQDKPVLPCDCMKSTSYVSSPLMKNLDLNISLSSDQKQVFHVEPHIFAVNDRECKVELIALVGELYPEKANYVDSITFNLVYEEDALDSLFIHNCFLKEKNFSDPTAIDTIVMMVSSTKPDTLPNPGLSLISPRKVPYRNDIKFIIEDELQPKTIPRICTWNLVD